VNTNFNLSQKLQAVHVRLNLKRINQRGTMCAAAVTPRLADPSN